MNQFFVKNVMIIHKIKFLIYQKDYYLDNKKILKYILYQVKFA